MGISARGGELSGGRWLDIPPERIVNWLSAFAARHGVADIVPVAAAVRYLGADGAIAECHMPFPPLSWPGGTTPGTPSQESGPGGPPSGSADGLEGADPAEVAKRIAAHAAADRTVGVLLVRLGGYAAGVFSGAPPRLAASKTGARLVHGRSAAGGTSQQRFARRREKQASQALTAAADAALAVFEPFAGRLDAVVLGGDRLAIGRVRDDDRLGPFLDLAVERFLTVPEPRLTVLRDAPRLFRAVRIRLIEPAREGPGVRRAG